jgi:RNA polymerase sigma factor (sigma-70 family)
MLWTDENLLAAFRSGGGQANLAWRHILENWRGLYRNPILKMGGTVEEADDAMMEAAEAFQRRVSAPDFKLENKLSTYFVSCVINRWKKWANQNKRISQENIAEQAEQFAVDVETAMFSDELKAMLDAVIEAAVGERCRKMLGLFARGFSMKEIAAEMGFRRPNGDPNGDTAKNEKAVCQKKIIQYLLKNPQLAGTLKSYLS